MKDLWINLERKLKLRQYWGLWLLLLCEAGFIFVLVLWKDAIYLQCNDNLDSNVALSKMFYDNEFWRDRSTQIPMLGGIERSVLTYGYNFTSIIYYIFDTQTAFWVCYVLAVAFSGTGYFFLGNSIKKFTQAKVNPNIFCICGIIYIFLGMWAQAIIYFALIPWWIWLVVEIYRTKRKIYCLLFFPLVYNISTPLIGIFLIFYTVIFYGGTMIKEKKIKKECILSFVIIALSVIIIEGRFLSFAMQKSSETVKGLVQGEGNVYTNTIKQCISNLKDALLFQGSFYHSGLCVLKYIGLPLILVFFFLFNIEYRRVRVTRSFVITYDCLMLALFINACGYAFDNCYYIRKFIPFMSGFSFARFLWLSPFIVMMCVVMIIHYLVEKGYVLSGILIVVAIPLSVIWDSDHISLASMYNILHINYAVYVRGEVIGDSWWRWHDFYAEDLFEEIKKEISYDGEWSVAYGLDPAVLQYNGIRTLDGYYSNYPKEYKEKWERLIAPCLEKSDLVASYWQDSSGIRAYIYSTEWDMPGRHSVSRIKEDAMRIDPVVLKELGGEYVFSIVEIVNANELGLKYTGEWSDNRGIYNVRVYSVLE